MFRAIQFFIFTWEKNVHSYMNMEYTIHVNVNPIKYLIVELFLRINSIVFVFLGAFSEQIVYYIIYNSIRWFFVVSESREREKMGGLNLWKWQKLPYTIYGDKWSGESWKKMGKLKKTRIWRVRFVLCVLHGKISLFFATL